MTDLITEARELAKDDALNRLVKLGDMMGDGLHYEPGGKWIEREYRQAIKDAGLLPKKPRNTTSVDDFMQKRTSQEKCSCGGALAQTRKGSFRAKCVDCGMKWTLGRKKNIGGYDG